MDLLSKLRKQKVMVKQNIVPLIQNQKQKKLVI